MTSTFSEVQPWGLSLYKSENHVRFQTKRQKVDLITNPSFGRMLFLDGVLQSASSDEYIYHRELCKGLTTPFTRTFLVAGGSEGQVIAELLLSKHVKHITMVDWDEELVSHLRDVEGMNKEAFEDPRVSLRFEDIKEFLENTTQTFDCIILDLLDIGSWDDWKWSKGVFDLALAHLNKGGHLSMNIGREYDHAYQFIHQLLLKEFPMKSRDIQTIFVPSFQEPWHLLKIDLV
jgi:spermidine synthase